MSFARNAYERPPRAPLVPLTRPVNISRCDRPIVQIPKTECIEHEGYRRLVAALPCIRCSIAGYSQAAHPNVGKAKGAKADDRECFPLCCTRVLMVGCHYMHDQHQLFERGARRDIEKAWGATTRAEIEAAGLWPANLPKWSDS